MERAKGGSLRNKRKGDNARCGNRKKNDNAKRSMRDDIDNFCLEESENE
jgi:hypothetical protein